ncbi:RNA methyltransferase [Saccharomonospora sp. CUA-673]|uniref:TrmH family RNA methyltransferase n=1 Tax=Saccharomonospora sp. CUA-673 TaxID=1904969 RepID=UPI0009666EDE|nr:RNA methyltransferase [Saccharomonospora sp. CUA-673]OLT46530.1 RNA methyltransferase [Saccharomonospora sp. CUA-673]
MSPKDRFLTVYGRKPVLEALADPELEVDKVILADSAGGPGAAEIQRAAKDAGVPVQRASAHRVKVLAGNGKQDQGVLADVVAPRMRRLDHALGEHPVPTPVLVLDGITTPANVGMILRTATAAGLGGIVVPRRGVATLDPLVIKASAGVTFRAPLLRCATALDAVEQLTESGYSVYALGSEGSSSTSSGSDAVTGLFEADLPARSAFVLGGETEGVDPEVAHYVASWLSIPMPGDAESLNVSAAAAVLCFDLVRRGLTP